MSLIIFNFIDPEAAVTLQEKTIVDSQVEMMRRFGAPEQTISEAVEKYRKPRKYVILLVRHYNLWLIFN